MEAEEKRKLEKELINILKKIEKYDGLIQQVNEQFADSVKETCGDETNVEDIELSKINKIAKEYGKQSAKLLVLRDELFERGLEIQHTLEEEQEIKPEPVETHFGELDENGRPIGYIRVHGKWKKRKPKQ